MASLSVSFLTPHAQARSNKNNNNKPTRKQQISIKKSTLRPPLPSSVSGGQATTYTRLPPLDDVVLKPFKEIKLSDLPIPKHKQKDTLTKNSVTKTKDSEVPKDKIFDENVEIVDFEGEYEDGFDYGKFELFEVNSDDEFDSDGEEYFVNEIGFQNENENQENVLDFEESLELDDELREKEKGVPAVMRCFDRAKIYVKSGDGGNGVVAFRREKFVPLGGPSGGDGGRGGNVYLEVDSAMNSLLPFRNSIHFRAGRGSHGQGSKMNGAKGEDVVVKVPPGTVVRGVGKDGVVGDVLLELLYVGDRALLLPGGRGGRGNASFKSGANKVPRIAENGEEGPEM